MSHKNKNTPFLKTNITTLATIQLLLTLVVLLAGYYYSNRILLGMDEKIQNQLYTSAGGEENYMLLRELQKKQVETYIDDYSKQNPGEVEAIKRKLAVQKPSAGGASINYGTLKADEIDALEGNNTQSGSQAMQGTGAYLVIEFTQIDCKHCLDLQEQGMVKKIIQVLSPDTKHLQKIIAKKGTQAYVDAEKLECIKQVSGILSYSTALYGTIKMSIASSSLLPDVFTEGAGQNQIDSDFVSQKEYIACLTSGDGKKLLEKDIGHGMYMSVTSTPTIFIINKSTGEYVRLNGIHSEETYKNEAQKIR